MLRPVDFGRALTVASALALGGWLAGCEAGDTPPAVSPQNDSTDVPPPAQPTEAPAATSDETQYASGEYAVGENADAYDDDDPAALSDFRGALDPYGAWVDDGAYGTVWVPSSATVGADFVPYTTAGHWMYDDDWVWASDYPWGWAPFHYGRWVFIEGRGWAWIPGRVYRGAWVAWSVDDGYGYLGWAPLGPTFIWFGGRPVLWHAYIGPRWVYCPRGEVFSASVGTRVLAGPAAIRVSSQMRAYVPASRGGGGPPPARLGYAASQVPRVTAAAAPSVARAQAFARPSTAQPVGASAPTRLTATGRTGYTPQAARPSTLDGRPPSPGTSISTSRPLAGAPASARSTATPSTGRAVAVPRPAAPAYHPSGAPSHSSGGGHHR